MTLFGTTIDGEQIYSLVSLLAVLALWIIVLRQKKRGDRDLAERLEALRPKPEEKPKSESDTSRGPWG